MKLLARLKGPLMHKGEDSPQGALCLDVVLELEGLGALALTGPNGAGKTSVLRALLGLVCPAHVWVEVAGRVLQDSARGLSLAPEARGLGYCPQGAMLFGHMSALENVAFVLARCHAKRRAHLSLARGEALEALGQAGLAHLAHRRPHELSAGQQQAVAIVRALVHKPALALLDEPFSALDEAARGRMTAWMAERMVAGPTALVVVTHDLEPLRGLLSHVARLEGGRLVGLDRAQAPNGRLA